MTGSCGFVGNNLVRRLADLGANIKGAYFYKKNPSFFHDNVNYVPCDLMKKQDCQDVVQNADYVFHCAAITFGAAGMLSNPMSLITSNTVMHMQMLEAASTANVKKIVFISSTTGYPPAENRALKENEFFDGQPYEKYMNVGWMNRYIEVLCKIFSKQSSNFTTIVLRPTNLYGEHDNFDLQTSHVLPALIRKVVERHSPIEVWGTGEDIRDVLYIQDFIDAVLLATTKLDDYLPLNIGLGKGYSIKQMLKLILKVDGYMDAEIIFNKSKPSMIPVRLVDVSTAKKLIGFKPKTDLREGIAKTIKWYRNNTLNK